VRNAPRSRPVQWRQAPSRCVAACALALLVAGYGARATAPVAPPPSRLERWFDPANAPFIPIPEIDTEPHSGLTLA